MATDVSYSIGANTTKYERAMDRLKRLNTGYSRSFMTSFGAIGLAGAAAFAGVTAAIVSGTKSLAEFERMTLRTEALVKATGNAAGISAAELTDFAKALDLSTLADRDEIMNAINAMQTFKSVSEDVFLRSIELSQDLSEVLGTDLRSQAVQLGKALEDPIKGLTSLRRVGVSFTDSQKDTIKSLVESNKLYEAQSLILDTISGQVGGAGAAAAGGLAGQIDTLNYRWREFKEALTDAEAAEKSIGLLAKALQKTTEAITGFDTWNQIVEMNRRREISAAEYTQLANAGYEERRKLFGEILDRQKAQLDLEKASLDIALAHNAAKAVIPGADATAGGAEEPAVDMAAVAKFEQSRLMKALWAEVDRQAEVEERITQKKLEEQERRKEYQQEYWSWEFQKFGEQADQIIAREQQKARAQIELQQSVVAGIGDSLRKAGQQNEMAFKAYQAFQIAQVTITGIAAAVKAWDAGMSVGGPWAPAVAAAYAGASLAWTGAQLATIGGSSFSSSASSSTSTTTSTADTSTTDLDSIQTESTKPALHINIEGDFIGDEVWVDNLVDKINDAEDRDVYVNRSRYAREVD